MATGLSVFPEYGGGGDALGARRARRSFRYCVTACVLLSGLLWFSERYLRVELTECQYLAALTLEPESARAILRQVVKRDAELHKKPTSRYLAALAEREEIDEVLPAYEKAYRAAPSDANVALRYGCRLFLAGKYKEARERFRESSLQDPGNALPAYLEAAALYFADPVAVQKGDPSSPLALVAKTNSSGELVTFPAPLWAQTLPTQGYWYARLRREGVTECCAPLYRFCDALIQHAEREVKQKDVRSWDSWLATLEEMGKRLAKGKTSGETLVQGGALQAAAGIQFQIAAIKERQAVGEVRHGKPDEALNVVLAKLQKALGDINAFESIREDSIKASRSRYTFPLHLCWKTTSILILFLVILRSVCRLLRVRRAGMTLSHSALARHVLGWGSVLLFVLLVLCGYLQRRPETFWMSPMNIAWWSTVILMGLFGLLYPQLRLPKANVAAATHNVLETDADNILKIRRYRRDACLVLITRYYGIYVGVLLCVIALWSLGYRILFTVYPWQLELLVTGMEHEEATMLIRAFALL